MGTVGGPLVVVAIVVLAALIALFAVLHFRFHVFRRRPSRKPRSTVMTDSRIEVLETTQIDDERRLVLIRCDRIEHLVIVGGHTDLVVENDVRKLRGPGAPPAKIPGTEPEKPALPALPARSAPTPSIDLAAAIAPAPKAPEPQRGSARPIVEARPTPPAHRALAPLQPPSVRPAARNGETPVPAPPVRTEEGRAPALRPQPVHSKASKRDAPLTRRVPPAPPAPPASRPEPPLRATTPAPKNDAQRSAKPGGRVEFSPALPSAHTPWVEPDSIENEIVRALKVDPQVHTGQAGAPSAKTVDSSTTLGDLADRLEEALAREVQSAGDARPTSNSIDFGFESEALPAELTTPGSAAPQKEKRERSEAPRVAAVAPAPEAEIQTRTRAPRRTARRGSGDQPQRPPA